MISTLADVPQDTQTWLHTSVQSFFSTCNWENQTQRSLPPEVAILEQTATAIDPIADLSFHLKVKQFFASVNWDGNAVTASSTPAGVTPVAESPEAPGGGFTLTDFSDLF